MNLKELIISNTGNARTRFLSKFHQGQNGECWQWTASRFPSGYGVFTIMSVALKAHRVAYAIHYGKVPAGMCVCHRCDNPPCVNPTHLFLGTKSDNNKDRAAKGRSARLFGNKNILKARPECIVRGVNHRLAKLDDDKVRSIFRMHKQGISVPEMASLYGVDNSTVRAVIERKTWVHVSP